MSQPEPLQQPLRLPFSGRVVANRMLKAAMTERLASWNHADRLSIGVPTAELCELYARWASGHWGIILTGNIMLDVDNLESAGNMAIPQSAFTDGRRSDAFRALADTFKAADSPSLLVGQLSHPGRQVDPRLQDRPISSSPVPLSKASAVPNAAIPRPATEEEIEIIVQGFVHAAQFLVAAGFDGVELHAANGYLLNQFLSKAVNKRTDKYGGSLNNRARLLVDTCRRIRGAVPPGIVLGAKINVIEHLPDGFTPQDAAQLCKLLAAENVDFVELSGGSYEKWSYFHADEAHRAREAFFLEQAEDVVSSAKPMAVYLTGGLQSVRAMNAALEVVSGVGLARPAAQEPLLPRQIFEGKCQGAVTPAWGADGFVASVIAAGGQIRQISQAIEPFDAGHVGNVRTFVQRLPMYQQQVREDRTVERTTAPPVEGLKALPYMFGEGSSASPV